MPLPVPDPILDLDVCALSAATRRGDLTCLEVTLTYLARLEAINPRLRAVVAVNPQAAADAEALDALAAPARGTLHGVPILIKDNIDVAGLPTTAGSALLRAHVPRQDAPLVARLRAAGAVILGKANLTEWANFMTLGMPNGYSSHGGQTVNPWNTPGGAVYDTGGSSSGSGAAVAARLCAAAIGTETSGSVVSPAHENAVIGLKPTLGLVPRTGIVPISHSQDTAGPITRSARDAALILGVIAGPHPSDEASRRFGPPHLVLDPQALSGAHLGIVSDEPGLDADEQETLQTVVKTLRAAGAAPHDFAWPARAASGAQGWRLDVLVYEFKPDLDAYLGGVTAGPRSLAEVIAANDADPERTLRYGQTLLHAAQGTRGDLSEKAYRLARERDLRLSRTEGFDVLFAQGLDAVVFPGIRGYAEAARAGYPSVAVPVPLARGGRPGGVLLVGPEGSDARLLSLASGLNRALGGVQFPPDWAVEGGPGEPVAAP